MDINENKSDVWIVGGYSIHRMDCEDKYFIFKKGNIIAKTPSMNVAFLLAELYNMMDDKEKNKDIKEKVDIHLNECVMYHWYNVVDGGGFIDNDTTVQFIGENKGDYLLIGECLINEIGIRVPMNKAHNILLREERF